MERKLQREEFIARGTSPREKAERALERYQAGRDQLHKIKESDRIYRQAVCDHYWSEQRKHGFWR